MALATGTHEEVPLGTRFVTSRKSLGGGDAKRGVSSGIVVRGLLCGKSSEGAGETFDPVGTRPLFF